MTAFFLFANRVFEPHMIITRMNVKNFIHAPNRSAMLVSFYKGVLQSDGLAKFNIFRSSVTYFTAFKFFWMSFSAHKHFSFRYSCLT